MQDPKLAISGPEDVGGDDVTTWALPEGAVARLGRGREPDMTFSPEGRSLAIGTSLGLWLYDLATLCPIALWETERGMVGRIAFSPNGKWLAVSNSDQILKVLDSPMQMIGETPSPFQTVRSLLMNPDTNLSMCGLLNTRTNDSSRIRLFRFLHRWYSHRIAKR